MGPLVKHHQSGGGGGYLEAGGAACRGYHRLKEKMMTKLTKPTSLQACRGRVRCEDTYGWTCTLQPAQAKMA